MASAGIAVAQDFVTVSFPQEETVRRLVMVVGRSGTYETAQVGPNTYQFRRTYRPTWVIVLSIVLAFFLLLGLLLLLIRTTETFSATVTPEGHLVRVSVSGHVVPEVMQALVYELALQPVEPLAAAAAPGGFDPMTGLPMQHPAPGNAGPPPLFDPPPFMPPPPAAYSPPPPGPAPGAEPQSAPPVVPAAAQPPLPQHDRAEETLLGSSSSYYPSTASNRVLRLDDGAQFPLDSTILLGRDPSLAQDLAAPVRLVKIHDPGRSLSKTHLAVGLDKQGVWVEDRHSSNGSGLVLADGEVQPLTPGARTAVPDNAIVLAGSRRIEIRLG